jgi:large subunit ribosomal protein L31
MKPTIHPAYYPTATITCACGNTLTIGSTVKDIHVELCSSCHPFYTGQQKLVDTARRVDKFQKRLDARGVLGTTQRSRREKLAAKAKRRQLKADESRKTHSKHKADV